VKRATFLVLALSVPLGAQQMDRARTEALARRAADRLQTLHQEADRLAAEARTLLGDLRRLELERQIKAEEFRQADADVAAVAHELASLDREVQRLEQEEQAARPELQARLVELYKLGSGRYVRLLLSTSNARDVGQASRMVAAVAKRDRDRIATHKRRLEAIRASRAALEERSKRLAVLRASAERAQTAAARAVQDRNALIRQIDQRRDLNAQLAGELQSAQQKLQLTLKNVPGGGSAEAVHLPLGPFRGDLEWPVAGVVRQRFASSSVGAGPSNGLEIAAVEGLPVQAVHDGTVAFADTFAGYGRLVIVDHGAQNFSLYGHLLEIAVARGARVERGEVVGSVGSSFAGAAGLYFELRIDGRPVDPVQWLRKR
jgi:septal ring factor EnvC (AmiA/AmiB activator)